MHATIPKDNTEYDQYTVPDDCSCRISYLWCFPFAKHMSMASSASSAILSNFFEEKRNSKQPTIPFGIVACTFSDTLSRNSCMSERVWSILSYLGKVKVLILESFYCSFHCHSILHWFRLILCTTLRQLMLLRRPCVSFIRF